MVKGGLLSLFIGGDELALLRLQETHQKGRDREARGGYQQQGICTDRIDEQGYEGRSADGAETAARGDEAEQPFGLCTGKDIGHQAPEHRDDEEIEGAEPDKKGRSNPAVVGVALKQDIEQKHGDGDKPINPGQKNRQPYARGKPAENRRNDKAQQKRAGEKLLQMVNAVNRAHRVAQRTKDEIARQQKEEIDEGNDNRLGLTRLHVGDQPQSARNRSGITHVGPSWPAFRDDPVRQFAGAYILTLRVSWDPPD